MELKDWGSQPEITLHPLHPLREVRMIRGSLEDILAAGGEKVSQDYVSITLTDEQEPYQPRERLERLFSRILEVKIDNTRTSMLTPEESSLELVSDPREIFHRFFQQMQGRKMEEGEEQVMEEIFQKIGGEQV